MPISDRIEPIILYHLFVDEIFTRKVLPFLKEEYFFSNNEKIIFQYLRDYIQEYNHCPTKDAILITISNTGKATDKQFEEIKQYLADLEHEKQNLDWLVAESEFFCYSGAVAVAADKTIDMLDSVRKRDKTAIAALPEIWTTAITTCFDTSVGHDYMEDFLDRYDFYHKTETKIPTDLDYFNKITDGGITKKTLNLIMAPPGIGKTMVLCHLTAAALKDGYNVVYLTMEMSRDKIAERIDENIMGVTKKELHGLPRFVFEKKMKQLKEKTKGNILIEEYPTSSASVINFRHFLQECKMKKNFVPDMIVVDYLNICASAKKRADKGMYEIGKSISEELRALAIEHNVGIWSATQTGRAGFKSDSVDMDNVAESWGVPQTADLILALISSEELDQQGQMIVKQIKNRYEDLNDPRKFVIGIDRKRMTLFNLDEKSQKDLDDEPEKDDKPAFDKTSFGRGMSAERGKKPRNTDNFVF